MAYYMAYCYGVLWGESASVQLFVMLNMLILFTNFHCTRHERRCAADRRAPCSAMR